MEAPNVPGNENSVVEKTESSSQLEDDLDTIERSPFSCIFSFFKNIIFFLTPFWFRLDSLVCCIYATDM